MKPEEIIRGRDALRADRESSVQDVWQTIERFIMPFRGEFFRSEDSEAEVNWRKRQIYDSTAVDAAQRLASAVHVGITTPDTQWFELVFRDKNVNKSDEAKEYIEEASERTYAAINESNFNLEINEHYLDIVGYGSGGLVEEVEGDEDAKIVFQSIPLKELLFAEGFDGQPVKVYRSCKYTACQMVDKFGEKGVPSEVLDRASKPEGQVDREAVTFCIYKRKGIEEDDSARMIAPKARPWGYKYILDAGKEELGEEGGYYELPAFITRWRLTSGSRWGHGPGHVVLANILTLNELTETKLEALAKAVDPPFLTTARNIIGDWLLKRAGLTVVRKIDQIKELTSSARVDWANIEEDRISQSIKDAYFIDLLDLKASPAMTATEVDERKRRLQQMMAPSLARIETDLLTRVIKRTINILYRAGKLPEMPDSVRDEEIDIKFTGPLPVAMQLDEAASARGWSQWIASLAEAYPDMVDVVDPVGLARHVGQKSGVPASAMRGELEVKKEKKARKEQQQAQQQAMQANAMGQTIRDAGAGMKSMAEAGGGMNG